MGGRHMVVFIICPQNSAVNIEERSTAIARQMSPVYIGDRNTCVGAAGLSVRTSAIMSEMKQFTVPMLDVECLLSAKVKLRQEGLLDSHFKSNLDHVIEALDAMPASKRKDVSLLVEGERHLVKFVSGTPSLHYTARQGVAGPELLQRVPVGAKLTCDSIANTHFAGHRCRDDFESCMARAQQAVAASDGGLANVELKIACGELRLTYTTPQPQATIEIRPQRRVNLGKALTLQKVLEVKNSMEQAGATSRGLQACLQHLLTNHSQYQGEDSRIVLQSDGEMVELISGRHTYHSAQHFIFTDADYQVTSHKVQDIDLWDDE
ncbi:uncharacterized protein LOC134068171 isoform X1 [Sardina pilchardus]|uniref:uncharacterized protein LOC134068171 isoform X1 n=3 Tax=Sardina pilchardus TaxID=27697 RepID=UPI002E13559E